MQRQQLVAVQQLVVRLAMVVISNATLNRRVTLVASLTSISFLLEQPLVVAVVEVACVQYWLLCPCDAEKRCVQSDTEVVGT